MWKLLKRIFTEPIYPVSKRAGDLPSYLSLREIADLPPHHPVMCERDARTQRKGTSEGDNRP